MKNCNVVWIGPMFDPSGYGYVAREYLRQLAACPDMNVNIIPKSFWSGPRLRLPSAEREMLERMYDTRLQGGAPIVCVQHMQPSNYERSSMATAHIGLTTFETDSVPAAWIPRMRMMDEIWTYTEFNRRIFSRHVEKCSVVPHGVDSDIYHPEAGVLKEVADAVGGRFAFGSNFVWQPRKNPKLLIRAFYTAFKNVKDVCLVLKTSSDCGNEFKNEIRELKKEFTGILPEIIVIDSVIHPDKMPMFYNSLDAYVLLSRGEGWSLTHCEAMSSGIPAIGIGWGGNTAFMNKSNSVLVDYDLAQVNSDDAASQPIFEGHRWAEGKLASAVMAMRAVKSKRSKKMIKAARADMVRLSWRAAGQALAANIRRMAHGN